MAGPRTSRKLEPRVRGVLRVLYWVAVLAVSLALLVALILFFESRDESELDSRSAAPTLQV
jgi:hypothetical protein